MGFNSGFKWLTVSKEPDIYPLLNHINSPSLMTPKASLPVSKEPDIYPLLNHINFPSLMTPKASLPVSKEPDIYPLLNHINSANISLSLFFKTNFIICTS